MGDFILLLCWATSGPRQSATAVRCSWLVGSNDSIHHWFRLAYQEKTYGNGISIKHMLLLLLDMHPYWHQLWEAGWDRCAFHWNDDSGNATIWYLHETLHFSCEGNEGIQHVLSCLIKDPSQECWTTKHHPTRPGNLACKWLFNCSCPKQQFSDCTVQLGSALLGGNAISQRPGALLRWANSFTLWNK